jgi:hypothetical protein
MPSDLRVFVPLAIRVTIDGLVPRMEAVAGAALTCSFDLNPAIPDRISAGEGYDVGLTNPRYARALISDGLAAAASHRAFGRVPLAVGRAAGRADADRKDLGEIRAVLIAAESIAYTGAGTSGRIFLDALERMGLSKSVLPRSRAMRGGEPVASVASGEVELAIAPLTTILSSPGIVPTAVFPDDLGVHIDMSIFSSASPRRGAAALLEFLTAPELDAELAAAGIRRFDLD